MAKRSKNKPDQLLTADEIREVERVLTEMQLFGNEPERNSQALAGRKGGEWESLSGLALRDAFVSFYLSTFNATLSAKRCGLSEKSAANKGYALLHEPKVQKAVKIGLRRLRKKALTDGQDIILHLKRNESVSFENGNVSDSTRCLEILAKIAGLFGDAKDTEQKVPLGPRTVIFNYITADGQVVKKEESIRRPADSLTEDVKCLPQQTMDGQG